MAKNRDCGALLNSLPIEHIRTTDELQRVCNEALEESLYGIDTEFLRDKTYYPKLALVQLSTLQRIALIDPLAGLDLTPLFELLDTPSACAILHAATQDLELLWVLSGRLPARIFDTQLAAAFVGLGQQTSYGNLVKATFGIHLDKGEQFTDWMQRPLESSQVAYAADDVRYLRRLYEHLVAKLDACGRLEVVLEEQQAQLVPTRFELNPAALLKKVKGARGLPPTGQGIARELALWREEAAQYRDIPRKWVLSDDALVAIAKQKPRHGNDLRRIRGLHPREAQRSANDILRAVERGVRNPVESSAQKQRIRLPADAELAVDFMKPLLKMLCRREQIAPATVGTTALLEELVHGYVEGTLETTPPQLLQGWRGLLVGKPLLQFLNGELSVKLEAGSLSPAIHIDGQSNSDT